MMEALEECTALEYIRTTRRTLLSYDAAIITPSSQLPALRMETPTNIYQAGKYPPHHERGENPSFPRRTFVWATHGGMH